MFFSTCIFWGGLDMHLQIINESRVLVAKVGGALTFLRTKGWSSHPQLLSIFFCFINVRQKGSLQSTPHFATCLEQWQHWKEPGVWKPAQLFGTGLKPIMDKRMQILVKFPLNDIVVSSQKSKPKLFTRAPILYISKTPGHERIETCFQCYRRSSVAIGPRKLWFLTQSFNFIRHDGSIFSPISFIPSFFRANGRGFVQLILRVWLAQNQSGPIVEIIVWNFCCNTLHGIRLHRGCFFQLRSLILIIDDSHCAGRESSNGAGSTSKRLWRVVSCLQLLVQDLGRCVRVGLVHDALPGMNFKKWGLPAKIFCETRNNPHQNNILTSHYEVSNSVWFWRASFNCCACRKLRFAAFA